MKNPILKKGEKSINRLKGLRKQSDLKKNDVCAYVGISLKTLYNYENETVPIPSDKLISFAKLYKTTTDYILCLKDYDTVTVVNSNNEVLASVSSTTIIECDGYKVLTTKD